MYSNFKEMKKEEIKAMIKEKKEEIKLLKNEITIVKENIKAKAKQIENLKQYL